MPTKHVFPTRLRRPTAAFVFGMKPWQKFLSAWTKEHNFFLIEKNISLKNFLFEQATTIICNRLTLYVWGHKHPRFLIFFSKAFRIPLVRLEDGFLRSVGLGSKDSPPISVCFDKKGLHFDPRQASDLEIIIQNHDFKKDTKLLERASLGMNRLIELGLSKYNMSTRTQITDFSTPRKTKRILVIGQVDEDMSIIKGCKKLIDSNTLVRLAAQENPGVEIVYKPHPEIFHKTRSNKNSPDEVADVALIITEDIALSDILPHVDHLYTITSLAGFEALIRGIPVTCIGAPFYAGWGLTDDRQPVKRRKRKCSVLELFAAAYILYPRYYEPNSASEISFEEAIDLIVDHKTKMSHSCNAAL